MVLVDSSIWIAALAPHRNIEEFIDPEELLICPPVDREVVWTQQALDLLRRFILGQR